MMKKDCVEIETAIEGGRQCLRYQHWPAGTKPLISISCIVFNQIDYIERCIKGFLDQKTSFPVEILIHDDCSTDGTAELVKRYESQYPELIQAILQEKNQFSMGKQVNEFNLKRANGDYIALCHGDDFWIDPYKLEKQLLVIKNLGVGLCGHPAKEVDVHGEDLKKLTGYQVDHTTKFDAKALIKNNGNMLPFGSIMITKEVVNDILEHMPPVRFHTGIQMLGAWRRGLAIMPDVMMAYRVEVPGSTTEIMLGNVDKRFRTALLRVISIKYLKEMYGSDYRRPFDLLLAKQVSFFAARRFYRYAWSVLGSSIKGEGASSKITITSFSFLLTAKALFARIYKTVKLKAWK
jgi:glycosyltransferase involved in cell wall biosynthesis